MSKGNICENYELEDAGLNLAVIRGIVELTKLYVHSLKLPPSPELMYVMENLQDLTPETE